MFIVSIKGRAQNEEMLKGFVELWGVAARLRFVAAGL